MTRRNWREVDCGRLLAGLILGVVLLVLPQDMFAAQLHVGAATISITPKLPVAVSGQRRTRIARTVESPVLAVALAIETRAGDEVVEQAIVVTCDLVAIRDGIIPAVREKLRGKLPGFDVQKLILNATHTHTAPVMREGVYDIPADVMQPTAYTEFLIDQVVQVATTAWEQRQPGTVGWGLGHAVVAYNRRVVYADGSAKMYGRTDQPNFLKLEGPEDHGVEVLCFWDKTDKLIATAINVACPSQAVESRSAVNADFWHEIREALKKEHGAELCVLGWTGAAGDQSPRPMFRKAAEERMRKLRGLTELEEIARRVTQAWNDAYAAALQERQSDLIFEHHVEQVALAPRIITTAEFAEAQAGIALAEQSPDNGWTLGWHQRVIDRYQEQRQGNFTPYEMELHVLRLGDIAIATNEFEYFTEFGIQIKAKSKALQTFLIQLAGPGSYVPTQPAVAGGGYSATPQSNQVGPIGGQELVDRSVELINGMWK